MTDELFLAMLLSALVLILFIGYFITVLFSRIMFDMLSVRKVLAFIPFYNTYRIYKEYKGRVWKKNWGVAYLIIFLIPAVSVVLLIIVALLGDEGGYIGSGMLINVLIGGIIIFSILGIISSILNVILNIVLYLPIFETKFQKIVLVLNVIVSVASPVTNLIDNSRYSEYSNILSLIMWIVFLITYFVAATNMKDKVKRGEYVLQEKLDYTILSNDEIKDILKQRGRLLAVPNKDNKVLNSDEFKVDRIEYI